MRYNTLGAYLKERLGERVQKVTLDCGFTCPNRDGAKAVGGCTYCLPEAITPEMTRTDLNITAQLDKQTSRMGRMTGAKKFIAYFQAATGTYGEATELIKLYEEALSYPGVVGLAVSTRPDCLDAELLDYFEKVSKKKECWLEMGLQSSNDETLKRINRGHTADEFKRAAELTASRAVKICCHLILGLPGETKDDMLTSVKFVSALPVWAVKFHQLQIVKGTPMEKEFKLGEVDLLTLEEYAGIVVECVELLRPDMVVQRIVGHTPPSLLASPGWGIDRREAAAFIESLLKEKDTRQGAKYTDAISNK